MRDEPIENRFEILLFETVQEETERRAKQKGERERKLQAIEDRGECEACEGERGTECKWRGVL